MVSADDVAQYMLARQSMSAMKLQKLVYYAQAWHLAQTGEPLFGEAIEAWANGPVVRELYNRHRGQFSLSSWPVGDEGALSGLQRATVNMILATYGSKDAQWLSEETHAEEPWQAARRGIPDGFRSSAVIDAGTIHRFYAARAAAGLSPAQSIERP
jgi:uncharacterized phage-associated protein